MVNDSSQRPSPEQLLAQVQLEERRKRHGQLKVFLGYAAGVGKSFQMLDEGRRRRERGEDVVVCAAQPRYTAEIQAILQREGGAGCGATLVERLIRSAEGIDVVVYPH